MLASATVVCLIRVLCSTHCIPEQMLTLGSAAPGDPKIIEGELPDWWSGLPLFPQIKYRHPPKSPSVTGNGAKHFSSVKLKSPLMAWVAGGMGTAEKLIKVLLGMDGRGWISIDIINRGGEGKFTTV